jgi:beta-galactosidase
MKMSAWSVRCLLILCFAASSVLGCGKSVSNAPAPYTCSRPPQECLNEIAGDYAGTYSGETSGTWTATVSPSGVLTGTVHNTVTGSTFDLNGTADEAGRVVFGTVSDGTAFQGQIAADFSIAGTWNMQGYTGQFSGGRTSGGVDGSGGGGSGGAGGGGGTAGMGGAGGTTAVFMEIPAAAGVSVFTDATRTDVFDATVNKGWMFFKDVTGSNPAAEAVDFDDSSWAPVGLPHTWNATDGEDGPTTTPAYFRGVGWYRKHYTVPAGMDGKQIYLQFDAAAYITDLYVNGAKVGQHRGGYTAFRFDVTPAIKVGMDNVIAVKVDNSEGVTGANQMVAGSPMADVAPLSGDFTMFGGISRNAHVLFTDTLAISPMDFGSPGVYLSAFNVTAAGADFQAKVMLSNASAAAKTASVEVQILDAEQKAVLWVLNGTVDVPPYKPTDGTDLTTLAMKTGEKEPPSITLRGHLNTPHLWNGLGDPYVYRVNVIVRDGATVVDSIQQPFGFRSYAVDANSGFSLNGRSYPLRGVGMYQDHKGRGGMFDLGDEATDAVVGAGTRMIDRDFDLLKEIGANFVRFVHYPHSDYTYRKADEAGIVAWAENAFVNRIPLPATLSFQDNTNRQYAELIKQNFNHPSIAFWSMSNEILIKPGPDPTAVEASLDLLQKKLDPSRFSAAASVGGLEQNQACWQGDIGAFNEYQGWYVGFAKDFAAWADNAHALQQQNHPRQPLGLSEYGAGANPDPAYAHELPIVETGKDRTGGFQTEEYQAFYHETYFKKIASSPFLVLTAVAGMFDHASDYRNEGGVPGVNTKGLVTRDRSTKKDAFFFYKASWNKIEPFVHINSSRHATLPAHATEVKVYSNQPSVTLKLNGSPVATIQETANAVPHVFVFTGLTWVTGNNVVEAAAGDATDSVTWTN